MDSEQSKIGGGMSAEKEKLLTEMLDRTLQVEAQAEREEHQQVK